MSPVLLLCIVFFILIPSDVAAQNFEITDQQFDNWIFSNMQNPTNARRLLQDRIELEIERLTLTTEFNKSQKEKIRLAGKGDIKRFFDDVEQAHREFKEMQAAGEVNQQNVNEVYQLAMPLSRQLNRGLFAKDSLLQKVARASVDQLQAKQLREREAQLNRIRTQTAIAGVLANLGRGVPMLHEQRQQLSELLVEKVKIKDPANRYANYIVLYQMSELPEKKLAAIFDEAQLKAIKKNFAQAAAMKQTLQQMGMLDE